MISLTEMKSVSQFLIQLCCPVEQLVFLGERQRTLTFFFREFGTPIKCIGQTNPRDLQMSMGPQMSPNCLTDPTILREPQSVLGTPRDPRG